jgi:hypothetical protein
MDMIHGSFNVLFNLYLLTFGFDRQLHRLIRPLPATTIFTATRDVGTGRRLTP